MYCGAAIVLLHVEGDTADQAIVVECVYIDRLAAGKIVRGGNVNGDIHLLAGFQAQTLRLDRDRPIFGNRKTIPAVPGQGIALVGILP